MEKRAKYLLSWWFRLDVKIEHGSAGLVSQTCICRSTGATTSWADNTICNGCKPLNGQHLRRHGRLFEAKVFVLQFWGGPYVYVNELLAFSWLLRHSSPRHMLFCLIDVFLSFSSKLCWIPQYSSCNDLSFVFLLNIWNKFGGQCSYVYLV